MVSICLLTLLKLSLTHSLTHLISNVDSRDASASKKGLFYGENPLMLAEMAERKSQMELSCHAQGELFESISNLTAAETPFSIYLIKP